MSAHPRIVSRLTLADLVARKTIEVALDTEFHESHTLTIQAATRVSPGRVAVQVYRSPAIPPPPGDFLAENSFPIDETHYGRFCRSVKVRKTRPITPALSPTRMLINLFQLAGVEPLNREAGRIQVEAGVPNRTRNSRTDRWQVPAIHFVLIGHFLCADLARAFGRDFYDSLFRSGRDGGQPLQFRQGKLAGLTTGESTAFAMPPVVEYACGPDGFLYRVVLETRDTNLPYGQGSLEHQGRVFLGLAQAGSLQESDKRAMTRAFHDNPSATYGYAMVDVVNTLLLHERMVAVDAEIYRSFGVADDEVPAMKPTQGSRVSRFLAHFALTRAVGSTRLTSPRAMTALMKPGGIGAFGGERAASRFGHQTGQVHGGLILSRSPTRFWHEAAGMLRDVDMSGCYPRLLERINVYWGRPVVLEPGSRPMTLEQAVQLLAANADPDAWYIRATGSIRAGDNVLIPSAIDALTGENYRRRPPPGPDLPGSKLFSGRIESGIITASTWAMIQMLPPALRRDYELLSAESLVVYPRRLIAADGPAHDELVERLGQKPLPWHAVLDLARLTRTTTEPLDAAYASLRFPIGEYARAMVERRRAAQAEHGKGGGLDLAWKNQANTMYGVLASTRLPIGNAVAANVVTAAARAGAFALLQSLNAIQVVTDGCTYRRDQVPACTLARCLELQPDYMLRRAEEGGPILFQDPATIPIADAEFTTWYHDHARWFFGVVTEAGPTLPFTVHDLEHKRAGGEASFDALSCGGSGDHGKFSRDEAGGWKSLEIVMRGYGKQSKEVIRSWIQATFPSDRVESLPPPTTDPILLRPAEAKIRARSALGKEVKSVIFPLGHETARVLRFKPIRLSGFICRDPKQFRSLDRQVGRFENRNGCGLESMARRRGYGAGPEHSLRAVAELIYEHIRAGGRDLTRTLHMTRLSETLQAEIDEASALTTTLKEDAWADFLKRVNAEMLDPDALLASVICTREDFRLIQ